MVASPNAVPATTSLGTWRAGGMRRWCVGDVCASVVSTVRTQGVRARSGAIACRCCSRIAPIATWRESTALKITPFRADQLPEFKGLLFEQAVDDRPCTLSAGGGKGSHLGTNDRRAHAPIRPRGSRCRVVLSLHGRWGHRKQTDQPVLFRRAARPHGGDRQDHVDQIDAHLARLRDPTPEHLSFETWYAWGRRPVAT